MSRLWEDLAVLCATSGCELNLAVLRLAILLVVLCRSGREIWRFQAVAGNLVVSGFRVAVSGENWRGSGKFIDVAGNNWSRWYRNLVQKFSLKFSAQTAKSRINIGKFGDISLAFVRERKNEPKLKSGEFV